MKTMFASLLAFLWRVYIKKHNIDKYRYYRYFQKKIDGYRCEKIFNIPITIFLAHGSVATEMIVHKIRLT